MADDEILALDEETKSDEYSELVGLVKGKCNESEEARLFDENRWLRSYRNYRGIYGSDMAFTEKKSHEYL